jgi:Protein of unknown function (DUF3237)
MKVPLCLAFRGGGQLNVVEEKEARMEKPGEVQNKRLEYLFEMELQFQQGMVPIASSEGRGGEYIGSGDGTVKGPRISGTVRWDLFEEQEEALCRSNLTGVIETDDRAQIQFDSRGFFIKPDKSNPNKWITSAAVYLHTADQRYKWLNARLAVWVGEFDMEALRHHYQAYVQVIE